jgi:hypothetical protein
MRRCVNGLSRRACAHTGLAGIGTRNRLQEEHYFEVGYDASTVFSDGSNLLAELAVVR